MRKILLFTIFSAFCFHSTFAGVLELEPEVDKFTLGLSSSFYQDDSKSLIVSALSGLPDSSFSQGVEKYPNFGFTEAVYWMRVSLKNQSDKPVRWILELDNPILDDVKVYLFDKKQLVNTIYAYNMENIDPGLFIFLAVCNPGIKAEDVEKELLEQIELMKTTQVTTAELDKVKINTKSDFIYSLES